jgi:acetyl esterase/lipase
MLDDRNESASSHAITDERLWSRSANITGWRAYLAQAYGTDEVSPYAAPARAQDLHGLPPTYLAVGDLDLFLDEDIDYARRLAGAGVPTEMHVYSGAVHGFYTRLPDAALSRRFINDWDAVLQRVFGQQALPAFGSVRSSHP